MSKDNHYIVTSDLFEYIPAHIYASNRKEAARVFVEKGDNPYGYSADMFDGYDVVVVLASDVHSYRVDYEEPEPPPPALTLTFNGKGV